MCIWGMMIRIMQLFLDQIGNFLMFFPMLRNRHMSIKILKNTLTTAFISSFKSFISRFLHMIANKDR